MKNTLQMLPLMLLLIGWSSCEKQKTTPPEPFPQPLPQLPVDVQIFWTAYKFQDSLSRVGVTGEFTTFNVQCQASNDEGFLQGANQATVQINTRGIDVGGSAHKTKNVGQHFFSHMDSLVTAEVIFPNEVLNDFGLIYTLNGVKDTARVLVDELSEDNVVLKAKLFNVYAFNNEAAFAAFDHFCGHLHEGKIWPDVDVRVEITNWRALFAEGEFSKFR